MKSISKTRLTVFSVLCFVGCFLVLKGAFNFLDHNPEELRDFDHFLRTSEGELPYRDFVWFYGPLTPLVYGTLLKFLPPILLSARFVSFSFWVIGAGLLGWFVSRYLSSRKQIFAAALLVTGSFGYHSYSHNHIVPTLAVFGLVAAFVQYWESGSRKHLSLSFACLMVCFFCRPVLMGYGVGLAWVLLVLFRNGLPKTIGLGLRYVPWFTGILGIFFLIYGVSFTTAFSPRPWAILEFKGYPNFNFFFPRFKFATPDALRHDAIWIRASLESVLFYVHYLVWPTFLLTYARLIKPSRRVQAATIVMIFGWFASWDLLHYGFNDPTKEQALWVRGQYFFSLTAVSLFLWATDRWEIVSSRTWRLATVTALLLVGFWSYIPFLIGLSHFKQFAVNEFDIPVLRGILTHPERRGMLAAIQHINRLCGPEDYVVIPQYDPGIGRLLRCQDLFARDAYTFTRMPWYVLTKGETPYATTSGLDNEHLIQQQIAAHKPNFYLIHGKPEIAKVCDTPGWESKIFGEGVQSRRVCWGGETHQLAHAIQK